MSGGLGIALIPGGRTAGRGGRRPVGRGLWPAAPRAPPPTPAWGLRAPGPAPRLMCARGARRRPRCARPRWPAGPRCGVAHRASALQRHVLPEQQLQLVQEAHGGAALRPPPRRGPLLCAPRRPRRPPRRSASPARGRGLGARDRLRAGSAPAAAAAASPAGPPPAPPPLKGAASCPPSRPPPGSPARAVPGSLPAIGGFLVAPISPGVEVTYPRAHL